MSINTPCCPRQSNGIILRCQDIDFRICDRACHQSSVLSAALSKGSKENVYEIIRVESFHSDVVRSMVDFLCSGTYQAEDADEPELNEALAVRDIQIYIRHIHLNGIASYFNIPALASLSRSKLYIALKSATFPLHILVRLFAEVFRATSDRRMSVLMASVAMEHMEPLLKMTEFVELDFPHSFLLDVLSNAVRRIRQAEFQCQTEVIWSSQSRRG